MTQEILEKTKALLDSEDDELRCLARNIFWGNDPMFEDYVYLGGTSRNIDWEKDKARYVEYFAGTIKT